MEEDAMNNPNFFVFAAIYENHSLCSSSTINNDHPLSFLSTLSADTSNNDLVEVPSKLDHHTVNQHLNI